MSYKRQSHWCDNRMCYWCDSTDQSESFDDRGFCSTSCIDAYKCDRLIDAKAKIINIGAEILRLKQQKKHYKELLITYKKK